MRTSHTLSHTIISLCLLIMLVAPGFVPAVAAERQANADPRLLELAAQHPDDVFQVIVQKDAKQKGSPDDGPEGTVEKGGGMVNRGKKMDFIASFAATLTGKDVEKLARHPGVRWVSFDSPVFMAGGFGSNTYRDEFGSMMGYGGSNGTTSWTSTPWTEIGEADGPRWGSVTVAYSSGCTAGYCLRIGGSRTTYYDLGAYRKAKLNQATAATLTFNSRVSATIPTNGEVSLQVSPDGYSWTTLDTFEFNTYDSGSVARTYDITPYASSTTQVRFIADGPLYGYLYVDNFQIEYTTLSNSYIRSTQTNSVWAKNSTPGAGVTVAVVDSGISPHVDLTTNGTTTRIVASVDFTDTGSATGYDDYGHGTHVAGIIGGAGLASLGARPGNAPSVNLVNVKVSGADGSGYLSNVIAGLQWIYDNRSTYNIKVVNISMNSAVPEPYNASPIDAAVEILWFNGITVVVSAGNNGTANGPAVLLPPANDPFVITVGADDDMGTPSLADDTVPSFSAYGLTEDGFAKPDIVAPGRNIISLLASTSSTAYVEHPANRVDNNYFRMSGTSMAAPMVSGAVALMLQQNPSLTPDQIKFRLVSTANNNWPGFDPVRAGAGSLNTLAAVKGTSTQAANTGLMPSTLLTTGSDPVAWSSVGWNSVGWNSVGWNSVGWNSVGWNSVGWNSVGWNSVGWNTSIWEP